MNTIDLKIFSLFDKKHTLLLCGIVLLSFFLRLGYMYLYPVSYSEAIEEYGVFAENIYHGHGLRLDGKLPPTAFRTPVFPYWLASIYFLFGFNYKVALAAQCFLDALNTLLIFFLAKLLFENIRIGILASFLWAIYLPEFFYTRLLYAEILTTTLLITHIFFIVRAFKGSRGQRQTLDYTLAGIFLGLTSLCRPEYQFFFIFLLVPFVTTAFKKNKRYLFKGCWIMLFSFFLTLTPWIVRNYIHFSEFLPGATELGHVLYNRNIENEQGYKYEIDPEVNRIYEESAGRYGAYLVHPGYSETQLDRLLKREMLRVILNHPFEFAFDSFERFMHSWFNYHGWKDRPFTIKDLFFILANFIFFLSIIFSYTWYRQEWPHYTYPILLIIIYKIIIHSLIAGEPKSFLPIWPYFMLYFSFVFFKIYPYILKIGR